MIGLTTDAFLDRINARTKKGRAAADKIAAIQQEIDDEEEGQLAPVTHRNAALHKHASTQDLDAALKSATRTAAKQSKPAALKPSQHPLKV
jgi:hypothetical protein